MSNIVLNLSIEEAKSIGIGLGMLKPWHLIEAYPETNMSNEHAAVICSGIMTSYMQLCEKIAEYEVGEGAPE